MTGFEVRHGNPSPEELGVVVAVLSAAIASRVDPLQSQHVPIRTWAMPAKFLRPTTIRPGRGAWVRSGRPC